jgi:phosphoserine phosphatase
MDSTLINIECVDEIADAAGRKAEVAAITEAAMRGEITDYKESLRRRVALLKGVTEAHLAHVYRSRLQLNPGAAELVLACKSAGLKVLLVSGGFTWLDRLLEVFRASAMASSGSRRTARPSARRQSTSGRPSCRSGRGRTG